MPRYFPPFIILVGIICLTASCLVHDAKADPPTRSVIAIPLTTAPTTEEPDPFMAQAWRDNPTWSVSLTRLVAVCLNPDAFRLDNKKIIACGEALVELGNYYKKEAVQSLPPQTEPPTATTPTAVQIPIATLPSELAPWRQPEWVPYRDLLISRCLNPGPEYKITEVEACGNALQILADMFKGVAVMLEISAAAVDQAEAEADR